MSINSFMNYDLRIGLLAVVSFMMLTLSSAAPSERSRLYTKPDPSATGGIKGSIGYPNRPVEQVLAIPPDEPRLVYEGVISGSSKREFLFTGLPMRKYDLVVIYKDQLYEGLCLQRGEDTLTATDRQKVKTTIDKAEPYFTRRIIHRLEGTTGRGNLARCICTFMRDKSSTASSGVHSNVRRELMSDKNSTSSPKGNKNIRRTFRLFMLKDVGPGWQVVRSRDLYPSWTTKSQMVATHHYDKSLSRIRVTTSVKNIGLLNLKSLQQEP